MTPPWAGWKLKHLAGLIAVLAVGFAVVGIAGTALGFALCLPGMLAPPGRRLAALYWVAACYPMLILLSIHLTWLGAWCALGHPPRPSLDDPEDIGPIAVPYALTAILLFGAPIALVAAVGLTIGRIVRRIIDRAGRAYSAVLLGVVPLSWFVGDALLQWDPLHIVYWYMD
jgi:hypothetical protein